MIKINKVYDYDILKLVKGKKIYFKKNNIEYKITFCKKNNKFIFMGANDQLRKMTFYYREEIKEKINALIEEGLELTWVE